MARPQPANERDAFRIMVATDTHLGFMEDAFEEVLQLATLNKVDFMIHSGDLFHENKPSRRTLHRTIDLLKKYCLGDQAVRFEVVSEQQGTFHNSSGRVNYEDPNLNIQLPIFMIHGNHDDPSGVGFGDEGPLSAMHLLSSIGLINYFGKAQRVDDISLYPILLRKGQNHVALFGLGHIRDERLYQTFKERKVTMMFPAEDPDKWYNIMLFHQNRAVRSGGMAKSHVPETVLDTRLDFVVWGHEHACRITPEDVGNSGMRICQPGSSIVTSLTEGEACSKEVGLLDIQPTGNRAVFHHWKLVNVRPFHYHELDISSGKVAPELLNDAGLLEEELKKKVNEIIATEAQDDPVPALDGIERKVDSKPIIRLRVIHDGCDVVNTRRFGQSFVGKVANPADLLRYVKRRAPRPRVQHQGAVNEEEGEPVSVAMGASLEEAVSSIDRLTSAILHRKDPLALLPERPLTAAIHRFVEKEESKAIASFVNGVLTRSKTHVREQTQSQANEMLDMNRMEATILEKVAAFRESLAREDAAQPVRPRPAVPPIARAIPEEEEEEAPKSRSTRSKRSRASEPAPKTTARRRRLRGRSRA